jgi:hypothetical protein
VNVDASTWSANFLLSPIWNCNAAGTTTINSASGAITSTSCALGTLDFTNNVAQVGGGPTVMVVRLRGLTVSTGHVIKITGDKPVIFLVAGNVLVDSSGKIDAGAIGKTAGPGGNVVSECAGQTGSDGLTGSDNSGAGGGSFGTLGGKGGYGNGGTPAGGNAGALSTDTDLQPLRGGCSGGKGGDDNASSAATRPGAGGGAFEISASGTITIGTGTNAGYLTSNGGGGEGQPNNSGCHGDGGNGGGSGGAILVVSPALASFGTNGTTRVHGGGGGGGTECGASNPGQDGHQVDNTQANGGTGDNAAGGKGGLCAGSACVTSAVAGAIGTNSLLGGGGGGGGGGRVQVIVGATSMACN